MLRQKVVKQLDVASSCKSESILQQGEADVMQ